MQKSVVQSVKIVGLIFLLALTYYSLRILIDYLFRESGADTLFLIFGLIILIASILLIRKKYSKALLPLTLLFANFVFLPYLHFRLYENNKENYSYDETLLKRGERESRATLEDYIKKNRDIEIITKVLKDTPDSILNRSPVEMGIGGILVTENYIFDLKKEFSTQITRRPEYVEFLNIYSKRGELLSSREYPDQSEKIKNFLVSLSKEYEIKKQTPIKPQETIVKDFWLDSLTGFIFGDINALSISAKVVRLFQIICGTLLAIIISANAEPLLVISIREKGSEK